MSLITVIEKLQKKPLSALEAAPILEFQKEFEIDDDDPLIVVLALMARSQLILENVPNLLQQKVTETIELHRTVLRDQAVLISKELIKELAQHIEHVNSKELARQIDLVNKSWKLRTTRFASYFGCGMMTAACGIWFVRTFFMA